MERRFAWLAALPLILLPACTPAAPPHPVGSTDAAGAALLAASVPADGAAVRASPRNLSLTFRVPVRLVEVTVTGSGQTLPMMITSAGEQRFFSIPLPELEPDRYTVRWRASVAGASREGTTSFIVR